MRILFINNDGGGFADEIDIADGTSVQQLFEQRIKGHSADYLIRVNRQATTRETVLQPGDRVSITPTKIEGATRSMHRMAPLTKGDVWEPEHGSTVCI